MAEVTYYFNDYNIGWIQSPENMVDGDIGIYAATNYSNDIEGMPSNTCPGDELGTILKVELRAYGYGDGNDKIVLQPLFGIGRLGDNYPTVPGTSPGWTAYVDITNDSQAPPSWTFAAIQNGGDWYLKGYAKFVKAGKLNAMYCSKVEIRVTYTPHVPPEKAVNKSANMGSKMMARKLI